MTTEKYGKKTQSDFDEAQYQWFIDNYPLKVIKILELENKIVSLKTKIDRLENEINFNRFIENERKES